MCVQDSMLHHGDLEQKHSIFEIKYSKCFAPKLDNCPVFFFHDNISYYSALHNAQCPLSKRDISYSFIRHVYVLLMDLTARVAKCHLFSPPHNSNHIQQKCHTTQLGFAVI